MPDNFKESDHPRDAEGKFGSGGGGSPAAKEEVKPTAEKGKGGWSHEASKIPTHRPDGAKIVDKPPPKSAAEKRGIQKGGNVRGNFHSINGEFKEVYGKAIGFVHNHRSRSPHGDVAIHDPKSNKVYFVDSKNVFGRKASARSDSVISDDASEDPNDFESEEMTERVKAAGVMFEAPDGHVLMVHRTDGQGWAFPGGGIEDGELGVDAARREVLEETQYEHTGPLLAHTRRIDENVDFTTFRAKVESFAPILNAEHDGFQWIDRHKAIDTLDLHPGAKIALLYDDLDELGIAKAIRDGELISPQRYRNLLLVAMRITGTGAAYRVGLGKDGEDEEFVWRDPSFYLNDEFLQRCNGTPVIVQHPEHDPEKGELGILDGKEFADRCIGTVMLPYTLGQEIWGIVKVYDEAMALILETKPLSTSPCVVFRPDGAGSKYRLQDGSILLIEGKPALLDHLAIDEHGVWDKGGEPSGVLNQLEETTMPEEQVAPVAKPDSAEGSIADKILSRLDSASAEWTKRWDSMTARLDAFEKTRGEKDEKPPAEKEEPKGEVPPEEGETEERREGEGAPAEKEEHREGPRDEKEGKPEPLVADATDKPSGEEALKEERNDNGLTKNDCDPETSMGDTTKADAQNHELLRQRLDKLEARVPVEMPESERLGFVKIQARSERVRQAFGDSAGAPRALIGETLIQYRKRMLSDHQKHSPAWKDKDLSKINDGSLLETIEDQVYADALKASRSPSDIPEGHLRMVTEEDDAGRKVRKFFGDPEACWGMFKQPGKQIVGWNNRT